MPFYGFRHPKTGEEKEIFQKASEKHVFVDLKGVEWERIFFIPYAKIDSNINPFSEKDFAQKTKSKNYSVGDMWDLSKELSEKRESISGRDEVKEEYKKSQQKKGKRKK